MFIRVFETNCISLLLYPSFILYFILYIPSLIFNTPNRNPPFSKEFPHSIYSIWTIFRSMVHGVVSCGFAGCPRFHPPVKKLKLNGVSNGTMIYKWAAVHVYVSLLEGTVYNIKKYKVTTVKKGEATFQHIQTYRG